MSAGTSSVLPNNTYANPIQELWEPAGGGGGGGSAGVLQIVAGTNVTITPASGEGVVTINASGGSAGGVTEILTGPGISASAPSGVVTLENTGVTSLVAGAGIGLSGATGAVTVSTTIGGAPVYFAINQSGNTNQIGNCWYQDFGPVTGGLFPQKRVLITGFINLSQLLSPSATGSVTLVIPGMITQGQGQRTMFSFVDENPITYPNAKCYAVCTGNNPNTSLFFDWANASGAGGQLSSIVFSHMLTVGL